MESPHLPVSPRAAPTSPDSRAKAAAAGRPRGCSSPKPKSSRAEPWGSHSHLDTERPLGAASATTTAIPRAALGVWGQLLLLSSLLNHLWVLGACEFAGIHSTPLQRAPPIAPSPTEEADVALPVGPSYNSWVAEPGKCPGCPQGTGSALDSQVGIPGQGLGRNCQHLGTGRTVQKSLPSQNKNLFWSGRMLWEMCWIFLTLLRNKVNFFFFFSNSRH